MKTKCFAVKYSDKHIGFLCVQETGKSTVELAFLGVLKKYHRHGIGRAMFKAALEYAGESGYEFIQVKIVTMGRYDEYDRTNRFYQSIGFKEFEIFQNLWGEANPCQIHIMSV